MQVLKVVKTWDTGGGHAPKTQTTGEANGTIIGLTVITSAVTENPTVAVTFRDDDGAIIIPDAAFTALAKDSEHLFWFLSEQSTLNATENPVAVKGPLTVSIDPSLALTTADETFTVKVRIFIRQD